MHFHAQKIGGAALLLLMTVAVAGATPAAVTAESGWRILSLPTPALAPNGQLLATSCASATVCTAVGVAQDDAGHDVAGPNAGTAVRGRSSPRRIPRRDAEFSH